MKYKEPDMRGYFGNFDGKFVPESSIGALFKFGNDYYDLKNHEPFVKKSNMYFKNYKGITGEREQLELEINSYLNGVKGISNLPVAVGFGILNDNRIRNLIEIVEGVIIGGRVIKGMMKGKNILNLIKKFKEQKRC